MTGSSQTAKPHTHVSISNDFLQRKNMFIERSGLHPDMYAILLVKGFHCSPLT